MCILEPNLPRELTVMQASWLNSARNWCHDTTAWVPPIAAQLQLIILISLSHQGWFIRALKLARSLWAAKIWRAMCLFSWLLFVKAILTYEHTSPLTPWPMDLRTIAEVFCWWMWQQWYSGGDVFLKYREVWLLWGCFKPKLFRQRNETVVSSNWCWGKNGVKHWYLQTVNGSRQLDLPFRSCTSLEVSTKKSKNSFVFLW